MRKAVAIFEDGFVGEGERVAIEPEIGGDRAPCRQRCNKKQDASEQNFADPRQLPETRL